MFRHLLQGISRRLPSQCAICHTWPSPPVCEACVGQFAQPVARCRRCALPVTGGVALCGACVREPPPLDACVAAVPYAYPWSDLIVEFKFRERCAWATSLALILRSAPWVEPALDAADALIPLPLSRERLRWRGYNQAQLLAQSLDHKKTAVNVLLRTKDTPPQSELPRTARLQSVRDAFSIDPLQIDRIRGKRLVLIDDVMTSGASLHAAARELKRAGAAEVNAMVFARTE